MTILHVPDEKKEAVLALIGGLRKEDKIEYTLKLKDTLSDDILEQLKEIGVHYLTPK